MNTTVAMHANQTHVPFHVIQGSKVDAYQEKVVYTYADNPEDWRKAIGDNLLFQFGVYDGPRSSQSITLDESGIRYFDQQLSLAGLEASDRPHLHRILDLGCGWGYILKYLAERFPECHRLDGINISQSQLEYCAKYHAEHGLTDRINLYLCNAKDVNLLPDLDSLYDLVIIRGVISHFPNELYKTSMLALWKRVSIGGLVIISDNLYKVNLETYQSDKPDLVDRLACRHRKTSQYFVQVLEDSGFTIQDMRVLPSNIDVIHWLLDCKTNIEQHFPIGTAPGPLEELRELAVNFSVALVKDQVSTYSIILKKNL